MNRLPLRTAILAFLAAVLTGSAARGEDPPASPSSPPAPTAAAPTLPGVPAARSALAIQTPPRLLGEPVIPFPAAAVAAGIEGPAVVELAVDATGRVTACQPLPGPRSILSQAVCDASPALALDPARDEAGLAVAVDEWFFRAVLDSPDLPGPAPVLGVPGPELTRPPELVQFVDAPYPEAARAAGLDGTPVLQIDVDERGDVMDVRLAQGAGHGFDLAAVRAAWQFRFQPALAGDVPVPVTITYGYHFELALPPPPADPVVPSTADGSAPPAQDATAPVNFFGVLRERGERTPLPQVEVWIDELKWTAASDRAGRFSFHGVPPGTWHVVVATAGFEPFRTEEVVEPGKATEVTYYLRPSPTGANLTVVRVKEEKKEVQRRTLEIAALERIPGTFGDPIKAVQNLPGVARAPFDFGLLIVRGSAPEDTGVYVDGIRVPLLYHFGGLRSVLSPVLIDSIDFLAGGYGVTYGRTTGGSLDVKSRLDFPKVVHGLARVDLIDIELAAMGPLPRKGEPGNPIGGFALAGRRSYLDVVLPAIAPPQVDLSRTTLPRWWDLQGKVHLAPTETLKLGWFGYASDDSAGLVSDDPLNPSDANSEGSISTRTFFTRQVLYVDWRPTERFHLAANGAYGFDYNVFDLTQSFRFGGDSHSVTGRVDAFFEAVPWLTVHGGLDGIIGHYDFEIYFGSADRQSGFQDPNAESEPLLIDGQDDGGGVAAYVEFLVKPLGDRWLLQPGLRFDHYAVPGQFSVQSLDPRFSTRFAVTPRVSLKASVGLYHQNPQPYEWVEGTGDGDLQPESSPQVTFGGEFQITDFLSLDVDLFYKGLYDLVVPEFASDNEPGERLVWGNVGEGRVYGGELMLDWKPWKNFQGWIAYTYQRSFRKDHPEDDWYVYDFDQPHILDLVARYDLPWELSVGVRFRLVSGNPYTTAERLDYDVDAFTYDAISGEYNAERLPTFHQLDIRIDKQFRFRTWKLMAYLEILNVYNQANPEAATYNFDYSEQTFITGLPFLPNLGLRVDF